MISAVNLLSPIEILTLYESICNIKIMNWRRNILVITAFFAVFSFWPNLKPIQAATLASQPDSGTAFSSCASSFGEGCESYSSYSSQTFVSNAGIFKNLEFYGETSPSAFFVVLLHNDTQDTPLKFFSTNNYVAGKTDGTDEMKLYSLSGADFSDAIVFNGTDTWSIIIFAYGNSWFCLNVGGVACYIPSEHLGNSSNQIYFSINDDPPVDSLPVEQLTCNVSGNTCFTDSPFSFYEYYVYAGSYPDTSVELRHLSPGHYFSNGFFVGPYGQNHWWKFIDYNNIYYFNIQYSNGVWSGEPPEPPPPEGCAVDCFSNVLFLPGLEASRLYTQENGSENQIWEPNRNLDMEKLYLNPDGTSINSVYTRDVVKEGQGIINIYKNFSDMMDGLVADQKINAWEPYAYDWREGMEDIVNNGTSYEEGKKSLVETLQNLADTSKNEKVTIITHSNGGLLAKALLKKLQDDKDAGVSDLIDKVDVLILIASPQIGTATAVPAMLHGFDQNILWGFFMDEIHARELGRNMPSGYGLLPSREYINRVSASPVTFVDNLIPSGATTQMVQAYGSAINSYIEYKDFLFGNEGRFNPAVDQLNLPISASENLFSEAENLHDEIDAWTPPAGLRVVEIAGWGVDTVASFEYYPICEIPANGGLGCQQYTLDERPRFTVDGDKTVVVPSAHYMDEEKYWLDLFRYNKTVIFNRKHSTIFEIDPLLDFISDTLQNTSSSYAYLSQIVPAYTGNRLRLSIHSPATLDAYDNNGNHTGKICSLDSDLCQIEENIPNSSYLEFGEGKYLNLPEEEFARIVIKGMGTGTFTYESEEVQPDGTTTTTTFQDIPVTPQTTGEVTESENDSLTLALDQNGDGAVDKTLQVAPGGTTFFDIIPPELQITFDINTKDIVFSAIDTLDPNPIITKSSTLITLTDNAGNTTVIPFTKLREIPTRLRLTYNKIIRNGVTIPLSNTNIIYNWQEKKGILTDLDTKVTVKGVERNIFNHKKANNVTIIREKTKGGSVVVTTKPGFVSVTIITEGDGLKVSY